MVVLAVVAGLGHVPAFLSRLAHFFLFLAARFLNGFGTAALGTESTVFSARVNRSAASGPSIISGRGFMALW